MRKTYALLILTAMLLLLLGVAACGGDESKAVSLADESPQGILTATMTATEAMASARGDYKLEVSFEADASQLPAEAQSFIQQPITMAGTFASAIEPVAADMTLALSMAGETMDLGIKMLAEKAWMQFSDVWYEAPAEMMEVMSESTQQQIDPAQLMRVLADAGVDPLTWMKDLRLVDEETLDGTAVYHLAGTPDLAKTMADMSALMQDDEALKSLDPSGAMSEIIGEELMGGEVSLAPSPEDLQAMQEQLTTVFQSMTVDLWIAKDTMVPAKMTMSARIVPPAEEAMGLTAIVLAAELSFKDVNKPVSVEAPAEAQPWSVLEKAMEEDPASVLGPLYSIFGMTEIGGGMF
jgi:hypothetical protein